MILIPSTILKSVLFVWVYLFIASKKISQTIKYCPKYCLLQTFKVGFPFREYILNRPPKWDFWGNHHQNFYYYCIFFEEALLAVHWLGLVSPFVRVGFWRKSVDFLFLTEMQQIKLYIMIYYWYFLMNTFLKWLCFWNKQ